MQRGEDPIGPDAGTPSADDMGWFALSSQTNWLVGVTEEKDELFPHSWLSARKHGTTTASIASYRPKNTGACLSSKAGSRHRPDSAINAITPPTPTPEAPPARAPPR